MFSEAVILAGGFGTRLSHVVSNVPKPMAPVYGKPFLCYLLDRLVDAGIERIVLATGYKHEVIESYFGTSYRGVEIIYSQEETPLFTGGAIVQAARKLETDHFVVLNGDTLFDIDFEELAQAHERQNASITIALRAVEDTARYGAVSCTENGRIAAFNEKEASAGAGVINGGIYAINRAWLLGQELPGKFSFEKELLQPMAGKEAIYGIEFHSYFIDIGVPEDYFRAQREFKALFPADEFLFLDRDGVLNVQIHGDYVRSWGQWKWMDGMPEQLAQWAKEYKRVFLVTNQQGVGKGLMSAADLAEIHRRMLEEVKAAGGRIDGIYICTDLEGSHSPCRKPAIGMALQAQRDFPEVDFHRSIMIGDSVSDMLFARNAQMRAVYISKKNPVPEEVRDVTDLIL